MHSRCSSSLGVPGLQFTCPMQLYVECTYRVLCTQVGHSSCTIYTQKQAPYVTSLSQCFAAFNVDDHNIWSDSNCCSQIQTSKQRAIGMVHSYPFVPHKDKVMNALAELHNEPSVETLLNNTSKSDLDHSVGWQMVTNYLQTVNMSNMHLHVPLLDAHL